MNIWRSMLRHWRDDKGQSLVIVALAFVVLCGMVGLTFDIGNGYMQKQNLQAAVDAGALAGAQTFYPGNPALSQTSSQAGTAQNAAQTVANQNLKLNYTVQVGNNTVTVTGTKPVSTFFMKIFGINKINVSATAKAGFGPIQDANGIVPIGVTTVSPGQVTITDKELDGSGNWGFLNLNSAPNSTSCKDTGNGGTGGGSCFSTYMASGAPFPISVNPNTTCPDHLSNDPAVGCLSTKTGASVGLVLPGIEARFNHDQNITACQSVTTANSTCARVVTVPVITVLGNSGVVSTSVTGFASFYIEGYYDASTGNGAGKGNGNGNKTGQSEIVGEFINTITPGDINPTAPDHGADNVQLLE